MEEMIGKNIRIRKAKTEDLKSIFENIWSDADLASHMFWQPTTSLEEAKDRLARTIEFQKGKPMFFVALKETDEAIGMCGIREEAPGVYSEAGLAICQKYQHQGFGKEMLSMLLKLAFTEFHAETFHYYCMKENTLSKKLALCFGFKYESSCFEIRKYDQKEFEIEKYQLTKKQYEKKCLYEK